MAHICACAWRFAFRRTRRRAITRRAVANHVRRRTRASVLGVQVDLGSAAQDESRQGRAPATSSIRICAGAPSYEPWEPKTHFHFEDDHGSFAFAANRCVGTGKCRKHDSGTMCPSYMATKEEAYSTRGRARLLFEMLEGNPMKNGWQDEAVKDALDLCLRAKAARANARSTSTWRHIKPNFLSHYYETDGARSRRTRLA